MARRSVQQLLPFERPPPRRRSTRKLGRKPRPERLGFVPHVTRPAHDEKHPVHVSIKRARLAPSLRAQRVLAVLVREIAAAVARGVRVLHYSVQHDHVHLLIEADDRSKLARGMQLLFSRIAFAVNGVAGRSGSLFRDRHHRRALATPTEVRRALVYLLFNARKHDATRLGLREHDFEWLDECSSAMWFTDWDPRARPPPELVALKIAEAGPSPLGIPRTWLAKSGWKRGGGLIRFYEMPSLARR